MEKEKEVKISPVKRYQMEQEAISWGNDSDILDASSLEYNFDNAVTEACNVARITRDDYLTYAGQTTASEGFFLEDAFIFGVAESYYRTPEDYKIAWNYYHRNTADAKLGKLRK